MSLRVSTRLDQRLHAASVKGHPGEIRRVLDTGRVHVDCVDRDRTTPLILAAANGRFDCVEELLEQGADPSARRHTGTSALFFAAQGGYLDILSLLLDNGAPINQISKDGGTALVVGSQCGHLDIVMELLRRGADPHIGMRDRATAVFVAAQNGHASVVRCLIQGGARPNTRRIDGSSPLWIAAQMGHSGVVKTLLMHGADVDSPRHDGATPLFKAAHKGHTDVVRELLSYRPKLLLLKNGESPLHAASLYGHAEVVRLLLRSGADPSIRNEGGLTPLQISVQAEHADTTRLLRECVAKRREASQRASSTARRSHPNSCGSSRNGSLETIVETSPILGRDNPPNPPTTSSDPRQQKSSYQHQHHFASCELSALVDGGGSRPMRGSLAVGSSSTGAVSAGTNSSTAPSPSPSVVSEPLKYMNNGYRGGGCGGASNSPKMTSQSHSDLRTVKTFFQWTLSSLKRSNSAAKKINSSRELKYQ